MAQEVWETIPPSGDFFTRYDATTIRPDVNTNIRVGNNILLRAVDGYIATNILDATLAVIAGTQLLFQGTGGGGYLQGVEQTADPAAPSADAGRLFFKDNGAGKTQLVARFATGVNQVIATQP